MHSLYNDDDDDNDDNDDDNDDDDNDDDDDDNAVSNRHTNVCYMHYYMEYCPQWYECSV